MKRLYKLKYPIKTKGLTHEEELILLAYDMVYRLITETDMTAHAGVLLEDANANLSNLGYYIDHKICKGYSSKYFELTTEETAEEFEKMTLHELNKLDKDEKKTDSQN